MNSVEHNDLFLAAVVSAVIFCVLIAFSVAYVMLYQRKKKEQRLEFEQQLQRVRVEIQEQAFQQIGRELHDNVGQLLSTARMLLGVTERKLSPAPDTLVTANATVGQAIAELRALTKVLDREWLEQFSFSDNLALQIERINGGGVIKAESSGDALLNLSSDKQIILFRIVQEAIQNAIKHATPQTVTVNTIRREQQYIVTITDDGSGFSPSTVASGLGLSNMKQRARLLEGNIEWSSANNTGTTVTITIPFSKVVV